MVVSCLCRVRQRDFTQLHAAALCVSMCMPTWTRYVCGSAGTSRQRGTSTHYMHAAARHFHALYACGSAGTFTLSLSRQRGGTWACRRRRSAGLHARSSLFEFVGVCVRVCVELGGPCPAQPRQSCQPLCQPLRQPLCQSLCQFLSTACAHTPTREVALVALGFLCSSVAGGALATSWRGGDDLPRPGHGALVALSSWPVAVFSARFSWRCLRCSWRCSWRGVARGVASAGFVCRGPKKRRRADTEDEDTRKRPAAGSATWRHVLVRLHTRFVRCALLQHKLELDTNWIHEPGQRSGGLSPPRQLQIEQTGAGSTTACTSPRTRWRS